MQWTKRALITFKNWPHSAKNFNNCENDKYTNIILRNWSQTRQRVSIILTYKHIKKGFLIICGFFSIYQPQKVYLLISQTKQRKKIPTTFIPTILMFGFWQQYLQKKSVAEKKNLQKAKNRSKRTLIPY